MGCVHGRATNGAGGDDIREKELKAVLKAIAQRYRKARIDLDQAEQKAIERINTLYHQKQFNGGTASDLQELKSNSTEDKKALFGRMQTFASRLRRNALGLPPEHELTAVKKGCMVPLKLLMETDADRLIHLEKQVIELEKASKGFKKKMTKAIRDRKRMEIVVPTDMALPVQSPLCRFSDLKICVCWPLVYEYIEQKGPVCGAASVASALNILTRHLKTRLSSDLSQEDLLNYYRSQKPKDARFGGPKHPTWTKPPSTAGVGNPLIMRAARDIGKRQNARLRVGYWLGVSTKCEVQLSMSKDPTIQQASRSTAWEKLKIFFGPWEGIRSPEEGHRGVRPHRVLIHHTTNHYSLVFGYREWKVEHGAKQGIVRQCLTATFNQQPKSWMPWDSVCDIIIQSKGFYNFMHLSRDRGQELIFAAELVESIRRLNQKKLGENKPRLSTPHFLAATLVDTLISDKCQNVTLKR
ncbi:hypothetical protein AAMO2058_001353400 [Amorphochlora amoebiformis]